MDNNPILIIVNIIALLFVPFVSVWVAQWLQDRAAKRKDKMIVFQHLMSRRATGWATPETVNILNAIDIIFVNDKTVRDAWASQLSKYRSPCSNHERSTAQCKLLEQMANNLGYKDKITWETIQNPYLPDVIVQRMENASRFEEGQMAAAELVKRMMSNPAPLEGVKAESTIKQEDKNNADA